MLALIDGDIVVHRIGYTTENDDFNIAKWRCDEMLDGILIDVSADQYQIYLSDSTENGFRKQIYPEYKANRHQEKPKHYDALKEYLLTSWDARITSNQEADDALGIHQCTIAEKCCGERDSTGICMAPACTYGERGKYQSIICSIDKDLLQIPGRHWNFVKKELREISPEEGRKRFYHQLLTGDTSDNVRGVQGIGPVKAARFLGRATEEEELFQITFEVYKDWLKKEWSAEKLDEFQEKQVANIVLTTGRVLKIRQEEEEIWQFPKAFSKLAPTPDAE